MPPGKKELQLDFTGFPPGTVTEYTTLVCLACVFDIFTTHFGLGPRTAYTEARRYGPTVEELTAPKAVRPFFDSEDKSPHCPYCGAAKRWHARLDTYGIEGCKPADSPRRQLVKSLPKKAEQFQVLEAKLDKRKVFFSWLDTLERSLNLDEDEWLLGAARAYLSRIEPKTDWLDVFDGLNSVRKSNRLDEGWELEGSRLFLSPRLYNEVLVVQYLVSRSHAHGGRTFEGRLTLTELVRRLRHSGYVSSLEVAEGDQFEVLESVIDQLAGGTGAVKMYYLVDRRDFLEKVKSVYARYE